MITTGLGHFGRHGTNTINSICVEQLATGLVLAALGRIVGNIAVQIAHVNTSLKGQDHSRLMTKDLTK